MHFDALLAAAQFAGIGEQPLHQFRRVDRPKWREPILKRGVDCPFERDAAPTSNEGRLSFAFNPNLQDRPSDALLICDLCSMTPVHLGNGDPKLGGEGLGERLLHDGPKTTQITQVVSHAVVAHKSAVRTLVLAHDFQR